MATQTITLPEIARRKVGIPRVAKRTLDPTLAEKAQTLLKYTMAASSQAAVVLGMKLQRVLHDLDISVLNPASVLKYRKTKAAAMTRRARERGHWGVTWHWEAVSLAGYKKPVPASALELAVRIAEAMPEAIFQVDELQRHSQRPAMNDPFLIVKAGSAKYYIAHWEEPTFKDS